MKKALFFLAAICTFSLASAQITQGTIGNGNYIDWEGNTHENSYGLDFNNDGILEFEIHDGTYAMDGLNYPGGGETNNVMADPEMWDFYATLSENDNIGPDGAWTGYGDAMLSYEGNIPPSFYVGFRIKYEDGMHYGWAKVSFANNTATWIECYYNATPNTAIKAGQKTGGGSQGIESAEINLAIQAMGNAQLRVNTDSPEMMEIYDLGGRKIIQTQTNNTVTLPMMGIYVVRVNQISRKVLVY